MGIVGNPKATNMPRKNYALIESSMWFWCNWANFTESIGNV